MTPQTFLIITETLLVSFLFLAFIKGVRHLRNDDLLESGILCGVFSCYAILVIIFTGIFIFVAAFNFCWWWFERLSQGFWY